ncbi:MAG TPA: GNAT family N-acetyltransferase [Anaerolineales bacterium]
MPEAILLRKVTSADLPIFYEHQRDPVAVQMAAFPSREREAFMAHWQKLQVDQSVILRTILFEGQVAGTVMSFMQAGKRQVGYWIAREHWGKGIATTALKEFLGQVKTRPLYAHVAQHNAASLRVLEKCGFQIIGEEAGPPGGSGEAVMDYVLKLEAVRPGRR